MLFKTNTKSQKHPSIRFLSKSKTQLVNQRKQKVAFSPGTAHFPIERDGVQLRQYWMTKKKTKKSIMRMGELHNILIGKK